MHCSEEKHKTKIEEDTITEEIVELSKLSDMELIKKTLSHITCLMQDYSATGRAMRLVLEGHNTATAQ